MARVNCTNLTRKFGSEPNAIVAVDNVNINVKDGEFTTIVGPSGCGKTTLLRMIGGLEETSSGSIHFDDSDITSTPPQSRDVSMVFQNIALFPFKSVRENIEYGLKYKNVNEETVKEKVEEMADTVGINDLLDSKPKQLSGGQQQRVALSRALIRDPTVFLLDEPMSDLDAKLKIEMRAELKDLQNKFKNTTLYVTHDQEEAMTLSDEVIVMNNGELQQKAPPYELYINPENIFVATFIGSPTMNIFEVEIEDGLIKCNGFDNMVEMSSDLSIDTDNVIMGVRPVDMGITNKDDAYINGKIKLYEQLGDSINVHLKKKTSGEAIKAVVPPHYSVDEFDYLHLTFDLSDVYLFNGDTGNLIIGKSDMNHNDPEILSKKPTNTSDGTV